MNKKETDMVGHHPLPHILSDCIDDEIRQHLVRTLDALISLPAANEISSQKRMYYTRGE